MYRSRIATILAAIAATTCSVETARAASIWNLAAGGSWNTGANWNPAAVPNATGDNATFNNAASGSNPAQTGNRAVTLDGNKTVGSVVFNNNAANTFTNTVSAGTPSTSVLTFDEAGAGPATISVPVATGTGNNTISAPMSLADTVVATVDNITASSAAGALNLTGTMGGAGGFTKNGDGLATFGTGVKTYTGATTISGGRMRISLTAAPSATSSFTINAGGQLDQISAGSFSFGSGPFNLNGSGPTSGPYAAFPGAIRPDTNLAITITNPVVLQSTSNVHIQGSATGSMTFTGAISGAGGFIAGGATHDANVGQIVFNGATNSYGGGTIVNVGALVAGATSVNAFGTGDVSVVSANAVFATSSARLSILAGANDAISDFANLSLAGGNVPGVADDGYAELGAGVNETVHGLYLGGVQQLTLGTYGSNASAATFKSDEYFSGTGVITLIPEPSSLMLVGIALFGLGISARRTQD